MQASEGPIGWRFQKHRTELIVGFQDKSHSGVLGMIEMHFSLRKIRLPEAVSEAQLKPDNVVINERFTNTFW